MELSKQIIPVFVVKPSYPRTANHAAALRDFSSSLTPRRGSVYEQLSQYSVGFCNWTIVRLLSKIYNFNNLP